ncbi:hypothetical protein [Algoriphagus formosus]|uniref:hypothetical protein n=1 Tax=Algoriphagus formosus TaxID=2007308 RepID=UPI001E41E320|nr:MULTISPECIES: hypothetical protein [Algoriphagus]
METKDSEEVSNGINKYSGRMISDNFSLEEIPEEISQLVKFSWDCSTFWQLLRKAKRNTGAKRYFFFMGQKKNKAFALLY